MVDIATEPAVAMLTVKYKLDDLFLVHFLELAHEGHACGPPIYPRHPEVFGHVVFKRVRLFVQPENEIDM